MARLRIESTLEDVAPTFDQQNESTSTRSPSKNTIRNATREYLNSPRKKLTTHDERTTCAKTNIGSFSLDEEEVCRSQKQGKLPSKSQARLVGSGKAQRSLNLSQDKSLLIPSKKLQFTPPEKLNTGHDSGKTIRASPKRTAKKVVDYQSQASLLWDAGDDRGSDWDASSHVSDDESSFDEDSIEMAPRSALRVPQQLASPSKKVHSIDLTESDSDVEPPVKVLDGLFITDPQPFSRPSTSSSYENDAAILKFCPPHLKSPSKHAPAARPVTPPQSPTKSKLASPTKQKQSHIPPTPHRPSIDAFWSQDVVNKWNDEYSPRKAIRSPKKLDFFKFEPTQVEITSDTDETFDKSSSADAFSFSPRKHNAMPEQPHSPTKPRSPVKTSTERAAAAAKKVFETNKHQLAVEFLHELDTTITAGKIAAMTAATGGVKLVWSNKLLSTAGRANWRREAVKKTMFTCTGADSGKEETQTTTTVSYRHVASIDLSTKIITAAPRLLNVLAHEYCHLANFMVSGVKDQPHGTSFKAWAAKVSSAFSDRGIQVTTKHDYSVEFKYVWMCEGEDCGEEYARHSKSIDVERMRCGRCRGRLRQIKPMPRAGKSGKTRHDGNSIEATTKRSDYQTFVKEHFKAVKEELGPKSPMKDVMKELGSRYRVEKESKSEDTAVTKQKEETVVSSEGASRVASIDDEVKKVARVLDFLTLKDHI